MTGEEVVFWLLAPIALGGAIGLVLARSAIHAALLLACTMLTLGVFYIVQAGPFIGFVQILVYTGAIMMLFLFVIMLFGRESKDSMFETLRGQRFWAVVLGIGLAALLSSGMAHAVAGIHVTGLEGSTIEGSNVKAIADTLFGTYVFAFEATAALLTVAAIGALMLAHAERRGAQRGQRDTSRRRFAPDNYPGPMPGPGVFATSDSTATPALLPDRTVAPDSLSQYVPARELSDSEAEPKNTEKGDE